MDPCNHETYEGICIQTLTGDSTYKKNEETQENHNIHLHRP